MLFICTYRVVRMMQNLLPQQDCCRLKESVEILRGSSDTTDDRYVVMNMQIKKVEEMRKRQTSFFDAKVIELQDRHVELDAKMDKLDSREKQICEKECQLEEQMRRMALEKSELNQIKDLLRIENESIILSTADLNAQILKYEALIKLAVRTRIVPAQGAVN